MRRKVVGRETRAVDVTTQSSRLRYTADYLSHVATYIGATLPLHQRNELKLESARALKAFHAHIAYGIWRSIPCENI